jgi:hypothetical protein
MVFPLRAEAALVPRPMAILEEYGQLSRSDAVCLGVSVLRSARVMVFPLFKITPVMVSPLLRLTLVMVFPRTPVMVFLLRLWPAADADSG